MPLYSPKLRAKIEADKAKTHNPLSPAPQAHIRRLLTEKSHDPSKQINLDEVINRTVALAQVISEKPFYPYQTAIARRIVESVLIHDGEVLTALVSRQSGKTQVVGSTVGALMIILPYLCGMFPESWHLNITDDRGVYRGFNKGIEIGIYGPRKEQSKIAFDRVKECFETESTLKILSELGISVVTFNGNSIKLSNGSMCKCESASEQSKIEGESYHLLILEEAQDISDLKIRKSLHPMVASTKGTILKVGTAKSERCDFYFAIKTNIRADIEGRSPRRNHFLFPYTVCQKYNSRYKEYVDQEKVRIGEESDEFRMSYGCVWIFERGMFVTQDKLFSPSIAIQSIQPWNLFWENGKLPEQFKFYSIVAGIDWGSSNDSTFLSLVAVNWNNPEDTVFLGREPVNLYRKHLVYLHEWVGDDYEKQFWEMVGILDNVPHLAKVVTDSNACGRPLFDRMSAYYRSKSVEVIAFDFNPKIKSEGYKSFYQDICSDRFTFPADKKVKHLTEWRKFTHQMLDLRKSYKDSRMIVAHPDEKHAHDDAPDSAMLACYGAATPPGLTMLSSTENNPFL
jgi:hypothetical protein